MEEIIPIKEKKYMTNGKKKRKTVNIWEKGKLYRW